MPIFLISHDNDHILVTSLNASYSHQRQRQQKLVRRAAEAVYNARADKKVCKNCGKSIVSLTRGLDHRMSLSFSSSRCHEQAPLNHLMRQMKVEQNVRMMSADPGNSCINRPHSLC